jgi:hypothetical protein
LKTFNNYFYYEDWIRGDCTYLQQHDFQGLGLVLQTNPAEFSSRYAFLNEVPRNKVTVIDFSQNYADTNLLNQLSDQLTDLKIPHILLSPDSMVSDNENLCHFPMFYLYGVVEWVDDYQRNFDGKKIYDISCLNYNPHTHRIHNYVRLREKNYKKIMLGWWWHRLKSWNQTTDYTIDPEILYKFDQLKQSENVDANAKMPIGRKDSLDIKHIAYQNSYINIVTETRMINELVLLTEKTWKPIASGQLFFIIGCQNSIAYLRSIGVDVFDDIIDHSYDSESDPARRIDLMHVSLEKLMSQNLAAIYQQTHERRQHNQQLFFSGHFGQRYIDQINFLIQRKISQI